VSKKYQFHYLYERRQIMSKRILILEKCEKCPFMKWSATCPCCDHNQSSYKEIPDFETIPDWCPLEDMGKIENNVRLLTQKLLKLEKENKELKYWMKKIEKDNDWLTGYEKAWKELPSIFEPVLLREDWDNRKEVMADTEEKYLGGTK